jgi:cytochrome c-type biogenesis protein CcmH/NrfF
VPRGFILVAMLGWVSIVQGSDQTSSAHDRQLDERVQRLSTQLECMVCQESLTLADADSELAVDLKRELREMLRRGSSDEDAMNALVQRYGEFLRHKHDDEALLLWLWLGTLLLGAMVILMRYRGRLRKRQGQGSSRAVNASEQHGQGKINREGA